MRGAVADIPVQTKTYWPHALHSVLLVDLMGGCDSLRLLEYFSKSQAHCVYISPIEKL